MVVLHSLFLVIELKVVQLLHLSLYKCTFLWIFRILIVKLISHLHSFLLLYI